LVFHSVFTTFATMITMKSFFTMEQNTNKLGMVVGCAVMLISHLFLPLVSFMGYSSTMTKAISTTDSFFLKLLLVLMLLAPIYLLLSAFSDNEALKSLRPIFRINLRMASLIPIVLVLLFSWFMNSREIRPVMEWGFSLYLLAAMCVAFMANKETVTAHPMTVGFVMLYVIYFFLPTVNYQRLSYTLWQWLDVKTNIRFVLPEWIKWISWALLLLPAYAALCANKDKELLAVARPALVVPPHITTLCISLVVLVMIVLLVICSLVYGDGRESRYMAPQMSSYIYLAIGICLTVAGFRKVKK